MKFPTPTDPAHAPVWENYIIAQSVYAMRGHIPEHALAVGVHVNDTVVTLRFQLSECTEQDQEDMEDTVSELEALVGQDVEVRSDSEVRPERSISPSDGVCWFFLSRV